MIYLGYCLFFIIVVLLNRTVLSGSSNEGHNICFVLCETVSWKIIR